MRRLTLTLALLATLAGCGSSSSSSSSHSQASATGAGGAPQLTVSAAASLKQAFTTYAAGFKPAQVRLSFGGSDILAAQLQQGVKPDLFASANLTLPRMLFHKGLVEQPVRFAANRLVLAVPVNSKIRLLADVERPGVSIAIGSPTVPIGIYTRQILSRAGSAQAKILANVRSQEADVSGIVGKLSEGAVNAGFTYVTNVRATGGKLRAIPLPASLQPVVGYAIAVVKGTPHRSEARQFIAGLLTGSGRQDLLRAGFLPPPPR